MVKEVMTPIPEVELAEDQHLEVGLQKFKDVFKEIYEKITDLEARVVPTTPPEELECRKSELNDVVACLTAFEEE